MDHPLFVIFFMLGAIVFVAGLLLRLFLYWQGEWDWKALGKGVFSVVFSAKILKLIEIAIMDGILQRKIFGQDKLRWLMKVLIMIGYPGILIAGHLKADVMPQFEGYSFLLRVFYAPFCDFYFFRDVATTSLNLPDALFAISFDLFGAMILAGELIAVYRRFIAKATPFKTSLGDIVAVNLLGGWFILRFFCEATSILTYSLPNSVAGYWFVSFGLSKIIAPLGLPWSSFNYPLWSIAGLFLAMLVAFIPYNKKLWHIITIPVVMFIDLMDPKAFQPGSRKAPIPLSVKELVSLDACVKCGSCVEVCPVYTQNKQLEATMGGVYSNLKSVIKETYGLPGMIFGSRNADEALKEYSDHPYLCTLCGRCALKCPAFIDTKNLRTALRGFMVEKGSYPQSMDQLAETLGKVHNIIGEPSEDRAAWVQALGDPPKDMFQREKAKVIYFTGCVASYFPMTKKIPQSFVQILDKAGVDFTLLGGEEWCCGFPLIAAGMKKKAEVYMEHNLEKVREKGAESVVFACPSCYHTWIEAAHRAANDLQLFHSTQFLKKIIEEGKITFKEKATKVTYHDPCDLGRASGVYEAPREILRAIPGVELVEMEGNRDQCKCCGGGGNLEMVRPDLSGAMAQAKIEEIKATGADMVITACQQCIRSIQGNARRRKIPMVVMDITEFVLKNMNG
ncbi:MAG: Fe-S oxidoreductase [Deltaproteobacteria bacterium]|jgi:heterodisulfide reductase subunit D|nr:Fe-S oxidoreductase [Deltaproteobacteria bacterium]